MVSRRCHSSTLPPIARQRPTAATVEAGCSRPWVTSSRMSSSIVEVLFGKRVKKGLEREAGISSRYLDSGTEDAILGRSLLHKNHNDEFLRCTEFDREGRVSSFNSFEEVLIRLQEMLRWCLGSLRKTSCAPRLDYLSSLGVRMLNWPWRIARINASGSPEALGAQYNRTTYSRPEELDPRQPITHPSTDQSGYNLAV